MKRNLLLKLSVVIVLFIVGLLSITANSNKGIITNIFAPRNAGNDYDVPLYITGIGLNRDSFVCIYENGVTLDGSTINPEEDCLVKLDSSNFESTGVLKSYFMLSDETYKLDVFVQDDCNDIYVSDYSTTFRPDGESPIIVSIGNYRENLGGDNSHYCNNGKYYNNVQADIYKYWYDEGTTYASQRSYKTHFYLGTYDEDTNTYSINTAYHLYRDGNNSFSGPSFGTVNSKYNYIFETNENIEDYRCTVNNIDGEHVTINGTNYCVMHLPALGEASYYAPTIRNYYIGEEPEKTDYDVEVVWNDDENRDGVRPSGNNTSITLSISGNSVLYTTVGVSKSNNWHSIVNLPIKDYKDEDINYTFTLSNIPTGYTCNTLKDNENGKITITCTHNPETFNIRVVNEWKELIDEAPESVTVNLLKNGEVYRTIDLTEDSDWEYIFEGVYKKENGVNVTYGIQQKAIEGYALEIKGNYIDGYRLINTQVSETRRVNITTEMICGDGTVTGAEQLVYGSDSSHNAIVATAKEGYEIKYIRVNGERLDIDEHLTTYTLDNFENLTEDIDIETCFMKIKKQSSILAFFVNPNTRRGFFTGTLIISLIAVIALMVLKIKNMPVNDLGFNFGLAVTAVLISIISLLSVTSNVVTNTTNKKTVMDPTDESSYIYITNYRFYNTEIRVDGNNDYHYSIKYTGSADENVASLGYAYKIPVEPNATYTITLFDMYCNGAYSTPTNKSFTVNVGDDNEVVYFAGNDVMYFGLEQAPECEFFVDRTFKVNKIWSDDYNQNFFPDSIDISGTVNYYDSVNDTISTTPYSCTVTEASDWSCETTVHVPNTWTFNNDEYDLYGTILEEFSPSEGVFVTDPLYYYVCGKSGDTDDELYSGECSTGIKAGHRIFEANDVYGINVTNELKMHDEYVDYDVIKIWNDNDNEDGVRPSSIKVSITASNDDYSKETIITEDNAWEKTISVNKKANLVSCSEDEIDNYQMDSCVIDKDNKTITVTNTIKDKYTIIKEWDDNNNLDGKRPSSVTVYVNGDKTDIIAYIYDYNNWRKSIYIDRDETNLSCSEGTITNYDNGQCVIDEDNKTITITNTIKELYTVTKIWNDNDNADGLRTSAVSVYVNASNIVGNPGVTLRDYNNWEGTIRISKDAVGLSCYESTPYYYVMDSCIINKETKTIVVTNTVKPSYTITKEWNDNDNVANKRPSGITVYYAINGSNTSTTVSSGSNWQNKIYITPAQLEAGGITSCSDVVADYHMDSCVIDNVNRKITITNTLNEFYTIKKVWDDGDNQDRIRPSSTTVYVSSSNGNYYSENTVYASDNWEKGIYIRPSAFTDGSTLSCSESSIASYNMDSCVVDEDNKTITVTNSHTPAVTSVRVTKSWEGVDPDDIPESVEVNLYGDGVKVDSARITADDEWMHIFEGKPKYSNGVEIVYTVSETMIDGYYVNISGNASSGFVITNEKTEETRKVNIRTSVICGEGTITGDEELLYGAHSTPYLIVATGALGYKIDYILFNDERKDFPDLTGKYALSGFYNVIEDKEIKVCFVESKELLEEELDGGDQDPDNPPDPGDNSSNNKEDPINPNTTDRVVIFIVLIALALLLFVKLDKKYKFLR